MPLWLVPGFTQRASSWDAVVAALPAPTRDEAHAVDVPLGQPFAEAAHTLGSQHGVGTWCGYSMGGRLALQLALDAPEIVRRLVLVSTTAGIDDEADRAARRADDAALAATIEHDGVDAFLERWLAQPLFASVRSDAPGVADRRLFTAAQLAGALRDLGTGEMTPLWDRLGELAIPVLVVHGMHDAKFTAIAHRLAGAIPGARLAAVECGHAIPLERPAELAALLHELHSATDTSSASAS